MTTGQNGDGETVQLSNSRAAQDASLQMTISVQMMLLLKEPRAPADVRALAFVFVEENLAMIERNSPGSGQGDVAGPGSIRDKLNQIYQGAAEQVIHSDSNGNKNFGFKN